MRRLRFSVAMSLDGFIAGRNGEFDWIPNEPAVDFNAFLAQIDTVLMGRHTWELVRRQGPAAEMPGMRTFVFSSTLRQEDCPGVTLVRADAVTAVQRLKQERGKDLWLFGGGVLFASLVQAHLVDTVELGIVPVLLGDGIPVLPDIGQRVPLSLDKFETFPSGLVLARYQVASPPLTTAKRK